MEVKNLRVEDAESIYDLEMNKLLAGGLDEMSAKMDSWKSRWRQEALDHYLQQGWCFALSDNGEWKSYVLAKVIPFFRSYTQVLWIETFSAENAGQKKQIFEVLYSYAKEKHLQNIFCEKHFLQDLSLMDYKTKQADESFLVINCSKNKD